MFHIGYWVCFDSESRFCDPTLLKFSIADKQSVNLMEWSCYSNVYDKTFQLTNTIVKKVEFVNYELLDYFYKHRV